MQKTGSHLQKQYVAIGDRISIQPERQAVARLSGRVGTVVAVFEAPRGSGMVQIEDDQDMQQSWFLYRNEMVTNSTR